MLITALTACSGIPAETSGSNPAAQEINEVPLVIYHISDNEIELRFTSDKLASIERLAFLAPTGGENGSYNTSVNIDFERDSDRICPFLMVFNEAMEIEYNVDVYSGEMEASVEGDTLICRIEHENIIAPFAKSALWHIDSENPQPFEGVITDDVSVIIEPVIEGFLPDEFKRSEYDDEYFKPETDDFIIVTYEIPVRLAKPEWHRPYGGNITFGVVGDEYYESSAKVTYLLSFNGDKYIGTKVRLEYASIEDAMLAGLDCGFVPTAIGMPDEKTEDETLIANFFEERDRDFFGRQTVETDYEGTYYGHFDQFRYFDFKAQDTIQEVERLVDMRLSDNSDTITFVPISSINYTACKTESSTLPYFDGSCEATAYSSKRTNKAGSNDTVLDTVLKLPGDVENFTPTTDDYAYVIEEDIRGEEASQNYGFEGVYEQFVELYSFDENGNVIQWVYRMYHIDHLSDDFEGYEYPESFKSWVFDKESGAYYIDYIAEGYIQTKDELMQELLRYGEHEGYYFSKP